MADDYYDVWLDILGRVSGPRFVDLLLDRAGVTLDPDLCRYLIYTDLRGPIGVLELAELAEHNHPKASRSLARLEQLGLITRAPASHDRRIKTASITAEGRRIVDAINQGRRRLLEEAFAGWSDHDRTELARLTRRFTDSMVALMERQQPTPPDTTPTSDADI
ncbi:MarR family winged helix-turn-helix transcriptional regulator [Actinomadura fibrosa]|uniref:MarR family winged helix-turn-helix transcriptional regulator n=1 Tax=Actinomadura fibrosa TaxID=111802 RepID=A0ABW2XT80_9ACTN|nr:MarR family transcriptional regulator [Actinomadura fibrosa]